MVRWVFIAISFQLACLQTEPIDLSADAEAEADAQQEVAETSAPAETEVDMSPEPYITSPCLTVTPSRAVFGGRQLGSMATIEVTIISCGAVPVRVTDFALTGSGDFSVSGVAPTTLLPAGSMTVSVSFMPSAVAAIGADGIPIKEVGELTIVSNASAPAVVALEGSGASDECPGAVIKVTEGDEVLPQTVLHLDGSASTAQSAAIVGYEWSVIQPDGSVSMFLPSSFVAAPRFEANIVGPYIFRLNVIDAFGNRSCTAAEYTVTVASDDAIHVELLWDTPGDTNQSNTSDPANTASAGSDVDLHFLSPKANGELFGTYDCHFENTNPEWGGPGPADNPRHDRDDGDGAGPENLNVDVPEQDVRYQVTAHYFDDWGFGDSQVTVRIYIYGILRDQWTVTLTKNDQWDSHYIDWPSGTVTRIGDGVPQIKQTIYEP